MAQSDWRWCHKCQGLFFAANSGTSGVCPGGGPHERGVSGNYTLAHNAPAPDAQADWRWCHKCQGLFFGNNVPTVGVCPAGGPHERGISGNYALAHDSPTAVGQSDWRWCHKCQGLFFGNNVSVAGACPAGGHHERQQSGNYTLPHVAAGRGWDSHTATPPSLLYPPDGRIWHARRGLAGTQGVTAPNGKPVCIGEIRGWLHSAASECNADDPDWHYVLEIDPEWLDQIGLSLDAYLLPGDILVGPKEPAVLAEVSARNSVRAQYDKPCTEVEIDGWPRHDLFRGSPPLPADWTFRNECRSDRTAWPDVAVWPYNPRNPKHGDPPLAPGQYVRVVGSLVTDHPHMMADQIATNLVLRSGYAAAVQALGQERADVGQVNAIRWMWGDNRSPDDESHPARYNEIHSPDYIEVLPGVHERKETVRAIAIVAQNGLFSGDEEEITAEIRPPGARPSPQHVLTYRKLVDPSTLGSTVLTDEVTPLGDAIRVHVKVQGQAPMGASGKFFGIYRVGWQQLPPSPPSVRRSVQRRPANRR